MRQGPKRGLTLIELMIAIVMFVLLASVVVYVFNAVLMSWGASETRMGLDVSQERALEILARELREARQIQSTGDEIRFTLDQSSYFLYYLYHGSDTYPPAFSQASYVLKRAALSGGINGTFGYGDGRIIVSDVRPPPTSDLSLSSNIITLDLTVSRNNETVRSRTQVLARNI